MLHNVVTARRYSSPLWADHQIVIVSIFAVVDFRSLTAFWILFWINNTPVVG